MTRLPPRTRPGATRGAISRIEGGAGRRARAAPSHRAARLSAGEDAWRDTSRRSRALGPRWIDAEGGLTLASRQVRRCSRCADRRGQDRRKRVRRQDPVADRDVEVEYAGIRPGYASTEERWPCITSRPGSRAARGRAVRPSLIAAIAALVSALVAPTQVTAVEVTFPLTIDYEVLRTAVRKHLGEESGGALELWRTPDGCGTFVVRDPVLEPADKRLRITGPASATAGLPLLGWCFGSITWTGHAEILARPELGHDWQIRFRDVDFRLYNAARQPATVATRLWTVVRDWSAAELETFSFDLGPPVEEVRTLLRSFSTPTGGLAAALQTLRPRELAVEPDAVRLRVTLDLPPAPPVPAAPERALTRAEIQQWEALLDSWDGFLGFLVKDVAGGADPETRTELLDLLLTARREVTAVLGRGPEVGVDPIRPLFLRFWDRLRAIMRARREQGQRRRPRPPVRGVPRRGRRVDRDRGGGAGGGPRLLGRRPSPAGPYARPGLPGRPARVLRRAGPEAPGPVPVQGPRRSPAADPAEAGGAPLLAPVLAHSPLGARGRGRGVAGALGAAGSVGPGRERARRVPGDRRPSPHPRRRAILRRGGARRPLRRTSSGTS